MNDGIFSDIIVLSDFDGTFRDGRHGIIPQNNISATENFMKHGGYFTLSTGRLPSVIKDIDPFFLSRANIPLIMSNGAMFVSNETGEMIRSAPIMSCDGNKIINDVLDRFSDSINGWVVYDTAGRMAPWPDKTVLDTNEFYYKMWFNGIDPQKGREIRDFISERFGSIANVFRSSYTCVEVVSSQASKGLLIDELKNIVVERSGGSIRKEDIVVCAIGDFENDIPMFNEADLTFCPANAADEVKKICDYVVCDETGGTAAEMISIISKLRTDGKI